MSTNENKSDVGCVDDDALDAKQLAARAVQAALAAAAAGSGGHDDDERRSLDDMANEADEGGGGDGEGGVDEVGVAAPPAAASDAAAAKWSSIGRTEGGPMFMNERARGPFLHEPIASNSSSSSVVMPGASNYEASVEVLQRALSCARNAFVIDDRYTIFGANWRGKIIEGLVVVYQPRGRLVHLDQHLNEHSMLESKDDTQIGPTRSMGVLFVCALNEAALSKMQENVPAAIPHSTWLLLSALPVQRLPLVLQVHLSSPLVPAPPIHARIAYI